MFNFVPGDLEATRKFLAAQPSKNNSFILLNGEYLLTPEDRKFFTCGIHYVSAMACLSKDRNYGFSFGMFSLPENEEFRGLEEVVRGVDVPAGYELVRVDTSKDRPDKSTAIVAHYGPKKPVSIDNVLAFEFHMQSFCNYAAQVLEAAINSRVEWRVPRKDFYFLVGKLSIWNPDSKEK